MYFIEKNKKINFFKQFDYILFLAVIILSVIGFFVVHSAALTRVDGGSKIMITQTIGLTAGIIICLIIQIQNMNFYLQFK